MRLPRHYCIIIEKEVSGVVLSFLIVGIIYRKEAFITWPKVIYPSSSRMKHYCKG
jgi:hypothetical protein